MPFTATYMKGRGNYLCLHRFDALKDGAAIRLARRRRSAIEIIDDWSRQTETGDRAEMDDLPEDLPFWTEIAATSENCIGADCPRFGDCFVTKMRQRAAESDVVIVNHHLLCADAVGAAERVRRSHPVVPATPIVDEAHQLEDVATQYFGIAVSNYRVRRLRARRRPRDLGEADARSPSRPTRSRADIDERARRARGCSSARCRCCASTRRGRAAAPARTKPRARHGADARTRRAGRPRRWSRALEAIEADDRARRRTSPRTCSRSARRAAELQRRPAVPDCAPTIPGYVYYLEIRGRGVFLRASPIDVSRHHPRDAARPHDGDGADVGDADASTAASTTSADGSASGSAHESCASPRSSTTRAQAILYLPQTHARPAVAAVRRRGRRARWSRSCKRTRGRAFVLFTSYANLRAGPRSSPRRELDVSDPRPGHGAALGAAARVQGDAERRAASRRPASGRASTSSARR